MDHINKKTKFFTNPIMSFTLLKIFLTLLIWSLINPVQLKAESSCIGFLGAYDYLDLKYFEGRDITVKSIQLELHDSFDPSLEVYFKSIERKPKLIAQALLDLNYPESYKMKTLVYPSAGYDGATGFLVSPEIDTVIGIDNHPFLKPRSLSATPDPYFSVNDKGRGWTVISEVDLKIYVGEIVLARLISAFSNIRIHGIYQITDRTKDGFDSALSHGLIVFDTGEGTPIRRYIHLESPTTNSYEMKPSSWWKNVVLKNKFQVLIRKAAMAFYNYPIGIELIDHLKTHEGLLIDGDAKAANFPDFNFVNELTGTPRLDLPISNFGYSSHTRLYFL